MRFSPGPTLVLLSQHTDALCDPRNARVFRASRGTVVIGNVARVGRRTCALSPAATRTRACLCASELCADVGAVQIETRVQLVIVRFRICTEPCSPGVCL